MQRGGPGSEGYGFSLPVGKRRPPSPPPQPPGEPGDDHYNHDIAVQLSNIASALSALSEGKDRTNYYDVEDSIGNALDESGAVSTAQNALRIDDSGYIRDRIFDRIGMLAPKLNVYNDGPGTWNIRASYEGQQFSDEIAIREGEKKTYFNVYELKHRSSTLGLNYRVTELDVWQQTAVSRAEKVEIYSTDKDVHFTGALAMNAHETENITGLLSNRYMIRGVNFQSIQPLIYRLIFWSSSTFNNTDLDLDTYIDDVELDMTVLPAFRINGINQYYLNSGDLAIIYEDFDITRTLHVSLQNISPVAKIAGALGAVQLDIKMSPRL